MNPPNKLIKLNLLFLLAVVFLALIVCAYDDDDDDVVNNDFSINSGAEDGMLILIQQKINLSEIRKKFLEFQEVFNVDFGQTQIDFDQGFGLVSLFKYLENSKYSTILYVLNETSLEDTGYCEMSEKLSYVFNKSIIFWPCPKMKQTANFLPAYETISYAVKSISQEFNWTEAVILAAETNWGLSLAIAANLHVPYQIEIGFETFMEIDVDDKFGKVIIICSSLNAPETQLIVHRFVSYRYTKILLIDMIAAVFNSENEFYKFINKIELEPPSEDFKSSTTTQQPSPPSDSTSGHIFKTKLFNKYHNLLVLTIFTEKFKQFLNTTLHLELIKHYHNRNRQTFSASKTDFPFNLFNGDSEVGSSHGITKRKPTSVLPSRTTELPTTLPSLLFDGDHGTFKSVMVNNTRRRHQKIATTAKITKLTTTTTQSSIYKSSKLSLTIVNNSSNNTIKNIIDSSLCDLKNFFNAISNQTMAQSSRQKILLLSNNVIRQCDKFCENVKNYTELYNLSSSNDKSQQSRHNKNLLRLKSLCAILNNSTIKKNNSGTFPNGYYVNDENEEKISLSKSKMVYSEFFILYDFISTVLNVTNVTSFTYDFIVLDFQSIVTENNDTVYVWRPFLILQQHEFDRNSFIRHRMLPGHHSTVRPRRETFITCGPICWGILAITIFILCFIIFASIIAGVSLRNYLLKKRLSKGPNKIVLSPSDFVFPVDSRRVDEGIEAMLCCWLQQLQEFGGPEVEKPDLIKGSLGSLKNLGLPVAKNSSGSNSLAKQNATAELKARYNGDLVQLKEIPVGTMAELKSKSMDFLVMIHGLRHENINPFIGWLSDPIRTAMVFEYCSRGSLQDVLIMDEIKLDWSFRLSLLTDLVRGMRYLHSSPIRVHGALTSRNCVVDARWVLKVTDYGLPGFYDTLGIQTAQKTAKMLLWTAPEALRLSKNYPRCGTQPSDVYSFGIIMQEVVVRGEPYCMLSLSPEEIITKIKKPPPLIRPSVSKGAAPPEAINIMRQCWAETPEMRPDFNTVYERFKTLNHGRKVNFVDTMFQMLEKYSNNLEELIRERTEQLDIERKKTEQLLNRMLPSSVAEKLKMGLGVDPEEFSDVTIYFSDIVGFTTIAAHCSPVQVVDLLNDLYTCFDATINAYNVYKVETIGDAYMVVSGMPVRNPDHAEQIATMALDLLHQSGRFRIKHLPGVPLQLRIGLHTGPCCAGVVGLTMPRYCLFGDTVNTASRMESSGSSWRIHMSEQTRDRLERACGYRIDTRGTIEIKGKGMMTTYWLLGKKGFDKVLPTPPPIGESHGLDESLIKNSVLLRTEENKTTSNNNMSNITISATGQSPSSVTEPFEIKVEITPPGVPESHFNSFSIDSNPNMNLNITIPEYHSKSTSISPQQRKLSELPAEGLLNPANFGRQTGSVNRLFRRLEDMMDLSFPYNHYRCLSPSESNLSQCTDGKANFNLSKFDAKYIDTGNKPGSTRLLRRQFSLDKEDGTNQSKTNSQENPIQIELNNQNMPNQTKIHPQPQRIHKQNSSSLAQDLEKIEEIPVSPTPTIDGNSPKDTNSVLSIQAEDEKNCSANYSSPSTDPENIPNNSIELKLNVETLLLR